MKLKLLLSLVVFSMFFINCKSENQGAKGTVTAPASPVVVLNNESFKKLVFNYEKNKEWKYEGNMPAIIDFYADWCAPCRQLSPLLEELAKEYEGKLVVYKIDTEKERDLAQAMGITGLPSLLFIPADGSPQMSMGFLPKETLVKAVNEVLLVKP